MYLARFLRIDVPTDVLSGLVIAAYSFRILLTLNLASSYQS